MYLILRPLSTSTYETLSLASDGEFIYAYMRAQADIFLGGWTPLIPFYKYILDFSVPHTHVSLFQYSKL